MIRVVKGKAMKLKIQKLLKSAIFIIILLSLFDYSLRYGAIYDRVPVVIKYGYYKIKYLAKVKSERLWYDYVRRFFYSQPSTLDTRDGYIYIADEYRPILKNDTTMFVDAVAGQKMSVGFAVQEGEIAQGSEFHFRIDLSTEGQRKILFESQLYPRIKEQDRRWKDVTFDLSPYAGKRVQLSFIINSKDRTGPRHGFFCRPFFYTPQESSKRMNVVLIILDTLGAKHLNCYGYQKRETSPFIDELARQGALFLNATSNSPGTFSSHMALLTGLYPSITGVSYRNWLSRGEDFWGETMPGLPKEISTFPELLSANGYYTIAYTGGYLMAAGVGYFRGFYRMIYSPYLTRDIAACIERWIDSERKGPFFIYFHSFEPHLPYEDERFVRAEKITATGDMRNEALYDGDIRSSDEALRDFVAFLKRRDLLKNTLIVLTADHGEEFGEHFPIYASGHGESLYDEQVRVPLIFCHPSIPPARFQKQVQLVDLRPTLLDLLGIEDSQPGNGISLKERLISGKEDNVKETPAFAEDTIYGPEWKMLRTGDRKILYLPTPWNQSVVGWNSRRAYMQYAFVPRIQSFDLRFDPNEKNNLGDIGGSQISLRQLKSLVGRNNEIGQKNKLGFGGVEFRKQLKENLRSLGYIE